MASASQEENQNELALNKARASDSGKSDEQSQEQGKSKSGKKKFTWVEFCLWLLGAVVADVMSLIPYVGIVVSWPFSFMFFIFKWAKGLTGVKNAVVTIGDFVAEGFLSTLPANILDVVLTFLMANFSKAAAKIPGGEKLAKAALKTKATDGASYPKTEKLKGPEIGAERAKELGLKDVKKEVFDKSEESREWARKYSPSYYNQNLSAENEVKNSSRSLPSRDLVASQTAKPQPLSGESGKQDNTVEMKPKTETSKESIQSSGVQQEKQADNLIDMRQKTAMPAKPSETPLEQQEKRAT